MTVLNQIKEFMSGGCFSFGVFSGFIGFIKLFTDSPAAKAVVIEAGSTYTAQASLSTGGFFLMSFAFMSLSIALIPTVPNP